MLFLPAFLLRGDYKAFRRGFRKTDFASEQKRALASEEHVTSIIKHAAREPNWILYSLNRSDGPGSKQAPVHDRRIHFDLAQAVKR